MRLKELLYSIASCFVKLFINFHLLTPRSHWILFLQHHLKRKMGKMVKEKHSEERVPGFPLRPPFFPRVSPLYMRDSIET